jgi:hypothetical protein
VNYSHFSHILVFAVALLASSAALATPPAGVAEDISELHIVRRLSTVAEMPQIPALDTKRWPVSTI